MRTLTIAFLFFFAICQITNAQKRDFYQIQVYHVKDKAQEQSVDKYLHFSYLPALHRAGIKTVGVFKPIAPDTASEKQIIVWMPFSSLDQFEKLKSILAKDAIHQTSGADFLKAPWDLAPFQRRESILLKSFPDAPRFQTPEFSTKPSERVYELRSYEGPTEYLFSQKVKMFNQGGEIKLFKSLGFNAVFYAEVISGSTMPNLMYLTTFASMTSHDAHWDAFKNHPDWKKLSALEEYKHSVSKNVTLLMSPTDYSDF